MKPRKRRAASVVPLVLLVVSAASASPASAPPAPLALRGTSTLVQQHRQRMELRRAGQEQRRNTTVRQPRPTPEPPPAVRPPFEALDAIIAAEACASDREHGKCHPCTSKERDLLRACREDDDSVAYTGSRRLECAAKTGDGSAQLSVPPRYTPCAGDTMRVAYFEGFWLAVGLVCGTFMRRRRALLVQQQQQRYQRLMERV
eukprot:TRINITY_DN7046_c0_g1_i1.p1 TRINITY_DN7046_c0_g1~~TRINITY_DN7046_c0_g1_i1.p1  ORF type:complete len:202 (+),score=18.67 TRINITY_DN7046_c0_g1_i1:66-671(+)